MRTLDWLVPVGIALCGLVPVIYGDMHRKTLRRRVAIGHELTRWRWPLRNEWLLLGAFAAGVVLGLWFGLPWWLTPLLGLAASWGGRYVWQLQQKSRVRAQFARDFPDAIDALTRAVLAGVPVDRALAALSELFPGELGQRFLHLSRQLELGVPFRDALHELSSGLSLPDVDFFCAALALNRDSGGQLSGLLQSLAKTLRERRVAQRRLQSLTAESRAAARIVAAMPLVILLMQVFTNPAQLQFLMHDPSGRIVSVYALMSIASGLFIIRRMSRF